MDELLNQRLEIFESTGQADPEVCNVVRDELMALDSEGYPVTEETVGMLTSHLVMALQRGRHGESITELAGDDSVQEELADHPEAIARAEAVAARVETTLNVALPPEEVQFIALHLAALDLRSGQ